MRTSAKSGLFLIEMIIAIMFFALCGAICTSLFVRAHLLSEETRRINMAVVAAQSVAECFKAADGSPEETARILETISDNGGFDLYYDSKWQRIAGGEYTYRVKVRIDEGSALRGAVIDVVDVRGKDAESLIYSLEAKKYVP